MSNNNQVNPVRIVIQMHGDEINAVFAEGPIPVEYAQMQTCFDSSDEDGVKTNIDGRRYIGQCGKSTKDNLMVLRTFTAMDAPVVWQADRDRRYVETDGKSCPHCGGGGDTDDGYSHSTGAFITKAHKCVDCGTSWKSIYTLNGIVEVRRKPVSNLENSFVFYPKLTQGKEHLFRAVSIHGVRHEDYFDVQEGSRPDSFIDDLTPEYYAAYLNDESGYQVCYAECGLEQIGMLRQFVQCYADSLDISLADYTSAKDDAI
jgi:ribosomal protein S27AE